MDDNDCAITADIYKEMVSMYPYRVLKDWCYVRKGAHVDKRESAAGPETVPPPDSDPEVG
jgi:hypothetical protein